MLRECKKGMWVAIREVQPAASRANPNSTRTEDRKRNPKMHGGNIKVDVESRVILTASRGRVSLS